MGLVSKSVIQDYWTFEETIETPFFRKYICRDRFLLILSNLHMTNDAEMVPLGEPGFDPLFKVRPLITRSMNKFSDVYSPEENLSFDEATCAWKGRLRFRVYNPAKPTKFGIKLYQVCESKSGYCLGFDVYTGSTPCTQYCDALDVPDSLTQTSRIVLGLLARCGVLMKGHEVYMDNHFTSPELFEELNFFHTYACGTLRVNRNGVPDAIKKKIKLNQGDCVFRSNGNQLAIKFHDKRDVTLLSTLHSPTITVLDKIDRKTNLPIAKPTCLVDYVQNMGGVDLADQINQYYAPMRKTVKWYKKLFFHLVNLAVINAFVLHKKFAPDGQRHNHHAFRISLCKALLAEAPDAPKPKPCGRRHSNEKPTRLSERHFPAEIPAALGAKSKRPCRDCGACNVEKKKREGSKRRQTSFWCPECEVPLCVPKCFHAYHTLQDYKSCLMQLTSLDSDSD